VFSGRLLGVFDYPTARLHLLRALLLTALALVVLGAYVLVYHAYTALKEARDKALYERYPSAPAGDAEGGDGGKGGPVAQEGPAALGLSP
jgi:hypothetical protein